VRGEVANRCGLDTLVERCRHVKNRQLCLVPDGQFTYPRLKTRTSPRFVVRRYSRGIVLGLGNESLCDVHRRRGIIHWPAEYSARARCRIPVWDKPSRPFEPRKGVASRCRGSVARRHGNGTWGPVPRDQRRQTAGVASPRRAICSGCRRRQARAFKLAAEGTEAGLAAKDSWLRHRGVLEDLNLKPQRHPPIDRR